MKYVYSAGVTWTWWCYSGEVGKKKNVDFCNTPSGVIVFLQGMRFSVLRYVRRCDHEGFRISITITNIPTTTSTNPDSGSSSSSSSSSSSHRPQVFIQLSILHCFLLRHGMQQAHHCYVAPPPRQVIGCLASVDRSWWGQYFMQLWRQLTEMRFA